MHTRMKCKDCGVFFDKGDKCPRCNNQKQEKLDTFSRLKFLR